MGAIYSQIVPLASGRCSGTDAHTAGVLASFGLPNGGIITGITVYCRVAGTTANHTIGVYTDAGSPVTVVELTIGTNVAKTCLQAKTATAKMDRDASTTTGYNVTTTNNDTSAEYDWTVWGTPAII